MGYESRVAIRVGEGLKSRVEAILKEYGVSYKLYAESLCKDVEYTFVTRWMKWYADFPEVRAIENLLEEYDATEDSKYAYNYCILGEEYGDIETSGNGLCFGYIRVAPEYDVSSFGDELDVDEDEEE